MHIALWLIVTSGLLVFGANSIQVAKNDIKPRSSFVTIKDNNFVFNNKILDFVGTNAYWLPTLNSVQDINNTLASISAAGIKIVRTWAFNDVEVIPETGTWFQLIANNTITVNNGTNGLQKLDTVVQLAEEHGLFVILSLTNNWNPSPNDSSTQVALAQNATNPLPRNTLSNDYGGMDVYVRQLGTILEHDQFYVNDSIIQAFQTYTTHVVTRYMNSSAIFSWELANDPRCNSTLPNSPSCQTTNVTQWHSTLAKHVTSIDPNHLVSTGNQGSICTDCAKIFQNPPTPLTGMPAPVPKEPSPAQAAPSAQPSPSAGAARRRRRRRPTAITKGQILQLRRASEKRRSGVLKKSGQLRHTGTQIRGRWTSPDIRRQTGTSPFGTGVNFDGSTGVDSQDILNIPEIGFGSFQLLPDQNPLGTDDPDLPSFNNTLQQGLDWIALHAMMAQTSGKPVTLSAFGLVTQNNTPFFIPFNSTSPVINSSSDSVQGFVTDSQRDDAYSQWLNAGIQAGIPMIQYQWSQSNLTTSPGTPISPSADGTAQDSPTTGMTPNDGYSIQGPGEADVQSILQTSAQEAVAA